ncbi:MAG: glycosyltransferase family 1 protein [Acidobacteriota bacterium]
MRIGIDGIPLASPRTGVGHYTFELAKTLALIAPSADFTLISPKPPGSNRVGESKLDAPANLHNIYLSPSLLNLRWWSLSLPIYLTRRPLDLFHGTNYDIPLWIKRPSVVTIHDLSLLLHPDTHEQRLVSRGRRRLPLMARSATMIITPSQSVKREACEYLEIESSKIAVTPLAPRSIFEPIEREKTLETRRRLGIKDDFVLFVGTIEPRKNLLTLARAFDDILRTTSLRPQLVIAGMEGWLTNDFFAFIKRTGLEEHICFTGYLHDEDLRALYSSCSVFAYPSLYEGFGLPTLEAMACGAPVICSRIPAIVETVGETACLIDPADRSELAGAIVCLLEDEQARKQLSMSGLERVKAFSWERTARATLEVYERALAM